MLFLSQKKQLATHWPLQTLKIGKASLPQKLKKWLVSEMLRWHSPETSPITCRADLLESCLLAVHKDLPKLHRIFKHLFFPSYLRTIWLGVRKHYMFCGGRQASTLDTWSRYPIFSSNCGTNCCTEFSVDEYGLIHPGSKGPQSVSTQLSPC